MTLSIALGMWADRPPNESVAVAQTADALSYSRVWIGEVGTYDAFALATAVGAATRGIALAVGPLPVGVRTATSIAIGVASVAVLTGRAVDVALGASSPLVVEQWHGRDHLHSVERLREYAHVVRSLLAGERPDFAGDLVKCRGYRLRLPAPPSEIAIAAFGSRALRVAAHHADRVLLTTVTPEAVARVRERLHDECERAGRVIPRLTVWLNCVVDPDAASYEQIARGKVGYFSAPGYREMFEEAGFGALVELERGGAHPRQILAAIPSELHLQVDLTGDTAAVVRRLGAYYAAGADEIALIPATASDPGAARTLGALAPSVLSGPINGPHTEDPSSSG